MKNKYIILSIVVILGLFIYIIVNETKARFTSKLTANSNSLRVAKFNVDIKSLINGELKNFEEELKLDIVKDAVSETIIKNNKIAPGFMAAGSFVIDPTGTEVTTTYIINIGNVEYDEKVYNNFILHSVTAYFTDETGEEIIQKMDINKTNDITYCSGDIKPNSNPVTIEVKMIWDYIEEEENTLGIDEAILEVPIVVSVEQKD